MCMSMCVLVDVIKTRYLSDIERRYSSLSDCVLKTFRSEGMAGFLKVTATAVRIWSVHDIPDVISTLSLLSRAGRQLIGAWGLIPWSPSYSSNISAPPSECIPFRFGFYKNHYF